jgi:antitoxin component YwqK of YwqJK toxin-antitoxin module
MKKFLTLLAITAVFASCKKETVTNPTPAVGKKIKQITYTDNTGYSETVTIGYDAKGRVLNYTEDDRTYTLSYENDTRLVVTSRNISDNSLIRTVECTLNNKGAITEMLYKTPAGVHNYTYQHTYDANNQMKSYKGFSNGGNSYEMIAEIVNGNVSTIQHYSDGLPNGNSAYYYEGAKPNKLPHTLNGDWSSKILFGKTFSHLPTEYKRWNQAGTLTVHNKSTYELDADGDVTKTTTISMLDGHISVDTYQYQ